MLIVIAAEQKELYAVPHKLDLCFLMLRFLSELLTNCQPILENRLHAQHMPLSGTPSRVFVRIFGELNLNSAL